MNAFLETVKKTEVPFGAGCLWWLGQMGLLVKLGETLLCVDYFAKASMSSSAPITIWTISTMKPGRSGSEPVRGQSLSSPACTGGKSLPTE